MELREYADGSGRSPFAQWFLVQDAHVAAKITIRLTRLALGNHSNVEAVGQGVSELKIDFGPGFRIYFARDGLDLVILLTGGTKVRQTNDIATAKSYWADYKSRKKGPV